MSEDPQRGFLCWFCGLAVEPADASAVVITIENLWRWRSGVEQDDDPQQKVFAHSRCSKERLRGASMTLEPSTFLEDGED